MLRIGLGSEDLLIWTTATAHTPGGATITVTDDLVQFAFTQPGVRPVLADWKTGAWTDGYASYALTPADIPLTVGLWDVWIKVTDNPQVDEERIDQLAVY